MSKFVYDEPVVALFRESVEGNLEKMRGIQELQEHLGRANDWEPVELRPQDWDLIAEALSTYFRRLQQGNAELLKHVRTSEQASTKLVEEKQV